MNKTNTDKTHRDSRLSSLSSSTMIHWLTTLLTASTLCPSSGLLAMTGTRRGTTNHAGRYVRSSFTKSTDSSRGAKSYLTVQYFAPNPRRSTTSPTRHLWYRHGDYEDSDDRQNEHRAATSRFYSQRISRWWKSIRHSGDESPDSEKEVDDYLEFLDRRYHRLHDKQQTMKGATFSALSWLVEKPVITEEEKADALFALGVAGLASERYLERHHLNIPRSLENSSTRAHDRSNVVASGRVLEAEVIQHATTNVILRTSPLWNLLSEGLQSIGAARRQLVAFQMQRLRSALAMLVKIAVSLPRNAVRAIWDFGGGKKTLTLTAYALVTAVVVIRPLLAALVNQSTMHG